MPYRGSPPAAAAGRAIIPRLGRLIAACRRRDVPFGPEHLPARPGELAIQGHTYDKSHNTPLDLALRARDVRCLIITGVVTEVRVNCTVLSAANRDDRVTVVTDGVASVWPELPEACFTIWRRKFARLRTTDEVLTELPGDSHEDRS